MHGIMHLMLEVENVKIFKDNKKVRVCGRKRKIRKRIKKREV